MPSVEAGSGLGWNPVLTAESNQGKSGLSPVVEGQHKGCGFAIARNRQFSKIRLMINHSNHAACTSLIKNFRHGLLGLRIYNDVLTYLGTKPIGDLFSSSSASSNICDSFTVGWVAMSSDEETGVSML